MIHLTRREMWLIIIVLVAFVIGNVIRACRLPHVEYIPSRVEPSLRILDKGG